MKYEPAMWIDQAQISPNYNEYKYTQINTNIDEIWACYVNRPSPNFTKLQWK